MYKGQMSKENQYEVVKNAVTKGWISFSMAVVQYEELEKDRDILIAALEKNAEVVFKNLSDELKKDKEIVLIAVRRSPDLFDQLSDEMKNDKDVCMARLDQEIDSWGPHPFNNFGPDAKKDREVVKKFLSSEVRFDFGELDEDFLKDKELVIIALENSNFEILEHVHEDLKNDESFVKSCLKISKHLYREFDEKFRTKDMVMYIIENGESSDAISWDSFYWNLLDEELREDRVIFKACLEKGAKLCKELSKKFEKDKELLVIGMKNSYYYLEHMRSEDIDEEILLAACEFSPRFLDDSDYKVPLHIRYDPKFYVEAIKADLCVSDYIPSRMLRDEETVRMFVREVPLILEYVMDNWGEYKDGYENFKKVYSEKRKKEVEKEEEEEGEGDDNKPSEEDVLYEKVLGDLEKLRGLSTDRVHKLMEAVVKTKYSMNDVELE